MYDDESGLYYLNSRYYDPETGRFVNADAIVSPDSLLGANLYAYCYNNPVNLCDPNGYNPLLGYGSSGSWVKTLQEMLNRNGYNLAVDGKYGPKTKAAVIGYQKAHGLKVDGLVGDETWGSLYRTTGDGTTLSAATGQYYYVYPKYNIKFTIENYNIAINMKQYGMVTLMNSGKNTVLLFCDYLMIAYKSKYGHKMPRTRGGIYFELAFHYNFRDLSSRAEVCDFDTVNHDGSQNWQFFEYFGASFN